MTALLLFADAAGQDALPWAQTGVISVVSGLLVWLVSKGIPGMLADERESRKEMAKQEREARHHDTGELQRDFQRIAKRLDIMNGLISALQQEFGHHDLTTRGLNPTAGDDMNERADTAITVYNQWLETIREIRAMIAEVQQNG